MDFNLFLKSGFMGFAIGTGSLMLVFFVAGMALKIGRNRFRRVYLLGGFVSFLLVDLFLYYRLIYDQPELMPQAQLFLAACIGGWLGSLIFGATQLKPVLMDSLKK